MRRGLIACAGVTLLALLAFAIAWWLCPFPVERLNQWPASPLVTDRDGGVLLRIVGRDDQWRCPVPLERISPWLRDATVAVEDHRFFRHSGVDWTSVARAFGSNLSEWRTVSGASTLTMQVCRMMDDRPRTWRAKGVEAFRALQLEHLQSKRKILETYLNIAPYGGNLRGAETAAQAYFGKSAADLSLGEAATLAGLPQSPTRYRPDRNPRAAEARRRHVLERMVACGMITAEQSALADTEPVTRRSTELKVLSTECRRPPPLSTKSSHAAWLALSRRPAGGRTTISPSIQADIARLVRNHQGTLPPRSQTAAVVIDIPSGDIVALVGAGSERPTHNSQVNGVIARRSPGSTLKPFIYAAAFEAGRLNADSTVYDVPIQRAGWSPANFDGGFAGAMPAAEALRRSLNIPAVLVAEGTGLARCVGTVEAAGVRLPADTEARGGLAVVVGSIEVTLLDLTNAYATLGRGGIRRPVRLFLDEPGEGVPAISAEVCAAIDDILSSRRRRPMGMEARAERDVPWFMWKTGTSSGRRDAWAVGHNGRFAVGVWTGRFSGSGSPEFVGAHAAEPLLAEMFDLPVIRRTDGPPSPAALLVQSPLPPPAEVAGRLKILSPSPEASFVAVGDGAIVHPRANRPGLIWFLNGRLLEGADVSDRLILPAGAYELRCVDAKGESAQVKFTVHSAVTFVSKVN